MISNQTNTKKVLVIKTYNLKGLIIMRKIILLTICTSIIFADININGDARVRPRLDLKTNSECECFHCNDIKRGAGRKRN